MRHHLNAQTNRSRSCKNRRLDHEQEHDILLRRTNIENRSQTCPIA